MFGKGGEMKAYHELTEMGKKRRLRKVAELGLLQYALEWKNLRFYTEETNSFFRFESQDENKFV